MPFACIVHSIKFDVDGKRIFKSRLVIQCHLDPEKDHVVNEAPTILRSSVRLLIALGLSLNYKLWSRDVKQAFVQSDTDLARELYVRLPKALPLLSLVGMSDNGVFHAIKPLYGLSESSKYWWQTYRS